MSCCSWLVVRGAAAVAEGLRQLLELPSSKASTSPFPCRLSLLRISWWHWAHCTLRMVAEALQQVAQKRMQLLFLLLVQLQQLVE